MNFQATVKNHVRGLPRLILLGAWAAPPALGETSPGNATVTNSIGPICPLGRFPTSGSAL